MLDAENTARRRVVELGPSAYGLRVVRAGLEADDRVVIEGLQRVRADTPATPDEAVLELDPTRAPGPAAARGADDREAVEPVSAESATP